MKAIICGGGTAGHVTPGLSIAEILRSKNKNTFITFVSRAGGEENEPIKKAGYPLIELRVKGIRRKISKDNLSAIKQTVAAKRKMRKLMKEDRPDIVIGTGGYVSYPVIKAARSLGIPTLLHESNTVPGLSTRLLANHCDAVLLNFPLKKYSFKPSVKCEVVGNPTPRALYTESRLSARKRLGITDREMMILSFGGSLGSDIINDSIINLMRSYSVKNKRIKHYHSSGRKYYEEIKKKNPDLANGTNGCRIYPYITNMHNYIRAADVIICRSGAMTLSEICASDAAAILIPSPNVTDNHQYENARLLCDSGAAIMIEEKELCERTLLDAVRYLEQNRTVRQRMIKRLKSFYKEDANERIYEKIVSLTSK